MFPLAASGTCLSVPSILLDAMQFGNLLLARVTARANPKLAVLAAALPGLPMFLHVHAHLRSFVSLLSHLNSGVLVFLRRFIRLNASVPMVGITCLRPRLFALGATTIDFLVFFQFPTKLGLTLLTPDHSHADASTLLQSLAPSEPVMFTLDLF